MEIGTFKPSRSTVILGWLETVLLLSVVILGIVGAAIIHIGLGLIALAYFARQFSQGAIVAYDARIQSEYSVWEQAEEIRQRNQRQKRTHE